MDIAKLQRQVKNAGIPEEDIAGYTIEQMQTMLYEHEEAKQFIKAKPIYYKPDLDDLAYRPPAILPGISANRAALMAAEPGIGKSALALMMCMAVASGEAVAGFVPNFTTGCTCMFISLEEETSEIILRAAAIRTRYGIDTKMNMIIAGHDRVSFLTSDDSIGTFVEHGEKELQELIFEHAAEFVVFDPLSVWPIGEENNSNHAAFFQVMNRISAELDCTIMVIHHTRKPPPGFKYKKSGDDVRGSSSIVGAVRTLIMVNWATDHIVMHFEKCQYSKPPPDLEFVHSSEIITTKNGNYETLVLAPYQGHQLTVEELQEYREVLKHLFDIQENYRKNSQSSSWIGYALAIQMQIDVGADEKNNANRTKTQKENRGILSQTIAALERMNYIEATQESTELNNRVQRNVAIYVPGNLLYEGEKC